MTPAASDLGNIPPGDQLWYWLAFVAILCLLGCAVAGVIDGWRWWRSRPRLRDLADDGDGQGGVPGRGEHPAATRAMALGDLVISPEGERLLQARSAALTPDALTEAIDWCGFCDDLAEVGDPASCGCLGACGRAWCPRRRSPVPVTWTEREEGVR